MDFLFITSKEGSTIIPLNLINKIVVSKDGVGIFADKVFEEFLDSAEFDKKAIFVPKSAAIVSSSNLSLNAFLQEAMVDKKYKVRA